MSIRFQKDPNSTQSPGSIVKLMNALIFQDWVDSGLIDTTVSVSAADVVDWGTNSNAGLISGDVLSYRDLLYGSLLPSGNDAAKCIARHVGALIIAGAGPGSSIDPVTRFVEAMNAKAGDLCMADSVFVDSFGGGIGTLMTASDIAKLMLAFAEDALLVTIGGTMTRGLTITGPNARTQNVTHTVDGIVTSGGTVPIPEFICGKTGTVTYSGGNAIYNSGGCLVILWESPTGKRRVSVVLGAASDPARYQDMRKMIDHELAKLGEL